MVKFNLLDELKKYSPLDKIEKKHVEETINFIENDASPFVRTNLKKHIVAGAYLLNSNLDKILLTHHKALGLWLPFGGHSDGEKNSLSVALREVIEESGINNINVGNGKILDVDIHVIPENLKKHEPEHKHIEIRFIFTTPETKFAVSDESTEIAWFTIEDFFKILLKENYYSGADRIIIKLKKYLKENAGK